MSIYTGQKRFRDRKDAGQQLGTFLKEYEGNNALVLGIPRGGLEIAYYVAQRLKAEASLVISKKLPYPGQPELAFGSITEGGYSWISEAGKKQLNKEIIDRATEEQQKEIDRRIKEYRNGQPLPDMKGRTVIIVDDGIATGATLIPVIQLCRDQSPEKIIVAVPVAGKGDLGVIPKLADEVKVLEQPELFYAVGQAYENFRNMSEEEVFDILQKLNA
ncbi:phosphoribosyltransferase family protein [Cytophagaceae bacterium ABcell3]|nr:phosphoribosyltransferase family protein [Cytophagaceae bacterium ABcell3]